ncbi:PH domain-containing protein [Arthrobacter sulfonylureivorans]|jgi:hypothetical protein|uniref:PH domain-containing protein n=1 Tax=Arthrobacter sulfonylureivorans TaxID=2486855 RepID=A0ABY3WH14_9MICC|nr:PH domain-containing protein [Arthrobacter sulfonylureivorans]UNK46969.1 PH domain-containing protein [Arthrobacter sulfonylureivorans]
MTTSAAASSTVFRPRSAIWFTGVVWAIVAVSLVSSVLTHGPDSLLGSWPLLTVAYVTWWLAWYPAVVIGEDGVVLRNPVRTISVPWNALVTVDTKYALTLVTPRGKYSAWAAPAPGMFGVHRARTDHVQGLPETTYGPAQSIRPGDLANSDSGAAAYYVRKRWAELLAADRISIGDADGVPVGRTPNWAVLVAGAVLVVLSLVTLAR